MSNDPLLLILAAGLLAFGLISQRIERIALTAPMLFLLLGVISGPVLLDWSAPAIESSALKIIAELTLALILFTDASQVQRSHLVKFENLPIRLLGIGLPLTIMAGAAVAFLLYPGHKRNESARWSGRSACTESDNKPRKNKGVVHSFTSGMELAEVAVELGFCLGINGIVTFNKADNVREVVAATPMSRLLLETDSPFLTPVPYRGTENAPKYLPFIAEKIAEVKDLSVEEVLSASYDNSLRTFFN